MSQPTITEAFLKASDIEAETPITVGARTLSGQKVWLRRQLQGAVKAIDIMQTISRDARLAAQSEDPVADDV